MKRIIAYLVVICLLLGFSACSQQLPETHFEETSSPLTSPTTPTNVPTNATKDIPIAIDTGKYTIYWENEKCYMVFPSETGGEKTEDSFLVTAQYPQFSSVQEMKRKISEGDLSEAEVEELRRVAQQGIVEICNINNLYEAVFPKGLELTVITFYGNGYDFEFSGNISGVMTCVSEEEYNSKWEHSYKGEGIAKQSVLISEETEEDRNALVRTYSYAGTEIKRVFYTYETARGQQRVYEIYADGVLDVLEIYGESNGAFYIVGISSDMQQRPSIDWMSSFYLNEFVETEVS